MAKEDTIQPTSRRTRVDKFIKSGMIANMIDPGYPHDNGLEHMINSTIDRFDARYTSSAYIDDDLVYRKLKALVATMTPHTKLRLKAELLKYAATKIPTIEEAAAFAMKVLPDLSDRSHATIISYTCDGKQYSGLARSKPIMYQNTNNELSSEQEKAREIFRKALAKLVEGLSGELLYNKLVNEVFGADVAAMQLKCLGSRHGPVHSGSFTTYYDYEYAVQFSTELVNIKYTSSSYFSGGWN